VKTVARLSFLLITVLWGSYYAVAKDALGRIDPVIFTFLEALVLVPVGVVLIALNWRDLDKAIIRRGVILGSSLCLAMLTVTVAGKFTAATDTAFFPSLGGVVAALITGILLRRPLGKMVWVAGALSLVGTFIILAMSGSGVELRGDSIAFLGALLYTVYLFLVDHDRQENNKGASEATYWLILGIEHLTVAFGMTLIVLLFGDWQHFHPMFPKDLAILVYIATAATFVPAVLSTFMLRYVDPLEASFIFILEPVWGAVIAHLYLGETMPLLTYFGGAVILCGTIIYTWGTSDRALRQRGARLSDRAKGRPITRSAASMLGYPLLFCGGVILLDRLGGFPPAAWLDLLRLWSRLPEMASQGQETLVLMLYARALCWGIAWGTLLILGLLTAISAAHRFLAAPKERVRTLALPASYQPLQIGPPNPLRRTTRTLSSPVAQRRQIERARRLGMAAPLPSCRIVDSLKEIEQDE
jgi:drug/metabolite transporter (DMT)-like permease